RSCEGTVCERRLLEILSREGPQMLDALCELPEFTWAQVLLAVDHLSRSREISIELVGRNEYQISLTEGRPCPCRAIKRCGSWCRRRCWRWPCRASRSSTAGW